MMAKQGSNWKSVAVKSFFQKGGSTFLGLSVSRVWTYAFFIALLNQVETACPSLPATSILFFLSAAVVALAIAFAAPRIDHAFARCAPWIVGVIGTIGALCVVVCNAAGTNALVCACVVFGGGTLALVRLAWGQLYATLSQREVGIYTASSFLVATLANIILKLLPWPCTVVTLIALPVISSLLIKRTGNLIDVAPSGAPSSPKASEAHAKSSPSIALAQLTLGMFVFVFANSLIRRLVINGAEQSWVGGWGTLVVDAIVALLFICLYVAVRGMSPLPAYRCTLILMVAGYTLCTLVPEERQSVTMSLVLVGYGLLDLLSWAVMANVASRARTSPLRVFGLGVGMTVAGRALGYVVGAICATHQAAGNLSLQSLSMLMVLLLVVACASILPESAFGRIGHPRDAEAPMPGEFAHASGPSFEGACVSIAHRDSLTAREIDVLLPLARGHNAQAISNELSITKGTVQTHVKHIYAKLGLHSQQELIELVESMCSRADAQGQSE